MRPNRTQIEQLIYECIIHSDKNQREISERIGVHESHISMFMNCKRSFSMSTLAALCIYFNLRLVKETDEDREEEPQRRTKDTNLSHCRQKGVKQSFG